MPSRSQVQRAIRSTAAQLSDIDRGQVTRRAQGKQKEQVKYEQAAQESSRRWRNDRAALVAESTWTCPYCGNTLAPRAIDKETGQWVEPDQYDAHQNVLLVRRDGCGCEGERVVLQEEAQKAEKERRSLDNREWSLALTKAGLVGWLATATFGSYEVQTPQQQQQKAQALVYCTALLKGDLGQKPWLVMYGNYGTGKTHLAAAILQNALAKGMVARFRVWPHWLEALQGSFGQRGVSAALVAELQGGDVVAIDDIDKENPSQSGWAEKKLFNALNFRYNMRLPTILTFNHAPGEMTPWLGKAVVDRILGAKYECVEFSGLSYRSGIELDASSERETDGEVH